MASFINMINFLDILYTNSNITNVYLNSNSTETQKYQAKLNLSNHLKYIKYDFFDFPSKCTSRFKCQWLCKNLIGIQDVYIDKIINPTDKSDYSLDFRHYTIKYNLKFNYWIFFYNKNEFIYFFFNFLF